MTPSRYSSRYADRPERVCSTPSCFNTLPPGRISNRCARCAHNAKRWGHELQDVPSAIELNPYVVRIECLRRSLNRLMVDTLKDRWQFVVDKCRGTASPSFKRSGAQTHNGWLTEASQIIRDIGEAQTWERLFDVAAAACLLRLERPHRFKSDEAFRCVVVELLRRCANVGTKVVAMTNHEQASTIRRSYRRDISLNSRLRAAEFIRAGLGAAAEALAKVALKRAGEAERTLTAYQETVESIAALAASYEGNFTPDPSLLAPSGSPQAASGAVNPQGQANHGSQNQGHHGGR